eukprot:5905663-Pleurochrysis_carterae.AAC.2
MKIIVRMSTHLHPAQSQHEKAGVMALIGFRQRLKLLLQQGRMYLTASVLQMGRRPFLSAVEPAAAGFRERLNFISNGCLKPTQLLNDCHSDKNC